MNSTSCLHRIEGPAGALELVADDRGGDCAVLCHPHPLYGGSMHDAVLGLAEQAWQRQGGSCIRFNYRGVGASEGSFDGGKGEAEDAICVANWARGTFGVRSLTLLGYSFGAGVAWRAVAALADVARVVLVAPPMPTMDFPHRPAPPTVLIHGDQDDFVDAAFASQWAAEQESARLITLNGANHFFSGSANALADAFDTAFKGALISARPFDGAERRNHCVVPKGQFSRLDHIDEVGGAAQRRAAFRRAAGMWKDRADLPEFESLRASWDKA